MSGNKGVLVYCEADGDKLAAISIELLGAGSRLAAATGEELSALVVGSGISGLAQEAIYYGAGKVYSADAHFLKDFQSELYLKVVEQVVQQAVPSIILFGQNQAGKELAPWLAFRLNSGASMDCLALEIDAASRRMLMTKPVYGGNAQAVQVCQSDPQIATVRSKAMAGAIRDVSRCGQIFDQTVEAGLEGLKTRVIERKIEVQAGIKLEDARVVVSGGRGMSSLAGFQQLEEIAGLLKGAVGATRPPCDNKWIADSQQIGLTGKVVSPELYIAVGLSGASQHLSGCSGAKIIIAINKDPEANIFKVADYGIVADWKTVIPAFIATLKEGAG